MSRPAPSIAPAPPARAPGAVPGPDTGPLRRTPALERLLSGLRRRLEGLILAQGAGQILLALAAWLAFAFCADWLLHVPRGVRLGHALVLAALPVAGLVWAILRPWRRRPDRAGLALLIERHRRDLNELFVSAVDLQRAPASDGRDPALVERVLAAAEARAQASELSGVLDPRLPRRWLAGGLVASAALVAAAAWQPDYASIFVQRLLGGARAWPQRTHLIVSVPLAASDAGQASARLAVESTPERIEVIVARGNDVPVLVRAEGKVPEEVHMHLDGGREIALASSGDGQFRTVLRGCQEETSFSVTGGDDEDGLPRVHVVVLDPPDVAGLAVEIEPPAYTGLAASTRFDRDVEVLAGSHVWITILPNPPEARGRVRLLPADRVLELVERPYPAPPTAAAGAGSDATAPRIGLGFELTPNETLRYRFELSDDSGLENPDPGLFGVQVVADRRPEVELLAPARGELDVVPGGALRLVARASDDFGVQTLAWRASDGARADSFGPLQPLEMHPAPPRMTGDSAQEGKSTVGSARLRVVDLAAATAAGDQPGEAAARAPTEGQVIAIEALARDNRPTLGDGAGSGAGNGEEGQGRSATVRVRVVSIEEFMRRLQDHLGRLRTQAGEVEALLRDKLARSKEFLTALESDQPEAAGRAAELAALASGQRRVEGDLAALARELAGTVESVLYARIDEGADPLLESLDQDLARLTAKGFDPTPWRGLATAARSGAHKPGLATQLIAVLELALGASCDDAAQATAALDRASEALDLEALHGAVVETTQAQAHALERVAQLIDRLAEWDNFQSVLNLARDLLNRQKTVRDRTKKSLEAR